MKRILSLLLAISVLTTCFVISAASAAEVDYNKDALLLLKTLGIIDFDISSDDALSTKVTRGEFAAAAAKSMGVTEKTLVSKTRYFKDVSPMDRSAVYIHSLYESGIVQGTGEREFKPNDDILPMDAAMLMLRVAGYHKVYTTNAGLERIISRYGLYDSLGGDYVTCGQMANLIYKVLMLPAPVLNGVTVSPDGQNSTAVYEIDNNFSTVLYESFGIYRVRGILSGAEGISIYSDIDLDAERIVVGDNVYKGNIEGSYGLLGYNVAAYIKDIKDSVDEAVVILDSGINKVYEIDLAGLSPVSKDLRLNYIDGKTGRAKNLQLSGNSPVLKNGTPVTKNISSAFNAKQGKAVIVDNGQGFVAKIFAYDSVLVGSVDTKVNKIYAKHGTTVDYDLQELKRAKIYLSDGTEGNVANLEAGMFLTVFRSENCTELYVSGTVIGGTATSIKKKSFEIDGVEYAVEPKYLETAKKLVKAGMNGAFYLNIYNEIAYFDPDGSIDGKLGFLVDAAVDEDAFSSRLAMKVFTAEGNMITLYGKDRVRIDGSVKKPDEVVSVFIAGSKDAENCVYCTEGICQPGCIEHCPKDCTEHFSQIIVYKQNDDGLVTDIDTVAGNSNGTQGLSVKMSINNKKFDRRTYYVAGCMLPDVVMKAGCPIFRVPHRAKDAPEKNFAVLKALDNQQDYNCAAYTVSADGFYADVILVATDDTSLTFSTMDSCYMVADVIDVLDPEDSTMVRKQLVLGGTDTERGGTEATLRAMYVASDYEISSTEVTDDTNNNDPGKPVMPDALGEGDLIRIIKDSNGEIVQIKLVYDHSDANSRVINVKRKNEQTAGNGRFVAGYAIRKMDKFVTLSTKTPSTDVVTDELAYFHGAAHAPIVVYDATLRENKVYLGSINDIITYEETKSTASVVIPVTYYGYARSYFIYKYGEMK